MDIESPRPTRTSDYIFSTEMTIYRPSIHPDQHSFISWCFTLSFTVALGNMEFTIMITTLEHGPIFRADVGAASTTGQYYGTTGILIY